MLYIQITKSDDKNVNNTIKFESGEINFSRIHIKDNHKFNRVNKIVWDDSKQVGIYIYGYYHLVHKYIKERDWKKSLISIVNLYKDDLKSIPNCFANGMYVGIIIDKRNNNYYIFNNHFNHLPVFLYQDRNAIYISTEFDYITQNVQNTVIEPNVIMEYLTFGMNYTDRSILSGVKIIGKCTLIKYSSADNQLTESLYYDFPERNNNNQNFSSYIEEFFALWQDVNSKFLLDSDKKHSLGLTGGLDSRLILGETYKYDNIFYNTGNSINNPDYIVASRLTKALGISNKHCLEDYENNKQDKFTEYIKYLSEFNYPMHFSIPASNRQLNWKKEQEIDIQITGNGGEYIGGEHYYTKRDSFLGVLKLSSGYLPKEKKLNNEDFYNLLILVSRAKKSDTIFNDCDINKDIYFQSYVKKISNQLIKETQNQSYYLEKARLLYKFTDLLQYAFLGIKNDVELISPFFDLELINFASIIPLDYRKNRKLVYNLIKHKYPIVAKEIIEGSVFSLKAPHYIFSTTKPLLKGLNKKGIKIPYFQNYIKKKTYNDSQSNAKIQRFKKEFLKQANQKYKYFNQNQVETTNSKVTIERAFNVCLTIMKADIPKNAYIDEINEIAQQIR